MAKPRNTYGKFHAAPFDKVYINQTGSLLSIEKIKILRQKVLCETRQMYPFMG